MTNSQNNKSYAEIVAIPKDLDKSSTITPQMDSRADNPQRVKQIHNTHKTFDNSQKINSNNNEDIKILDENNEDRNTMIIIQNIIDNYAFPIVTDFQVFDAENTFSLLTSTNKNLTEIIEEDNVDVPFWIFLFKRPVKISNNENLNVGYSLIISDNKTGKIYHYTNSMNHNYQDAKSLAYKIFLMRKALPVSKNISHDYSERYQQLSFHDEITTQIHLIGYFINILYYLLKFRTIEGFSKLDNIANLQEKNLNNIKICLKEKRPLSTMIDKPSVFLLIEEKLAIMTNSLQLLPKPPEKLIPIGTQCNKVGTALQIFGESNNKQINILIDSGSNVSLARKHLVAEEDIVDNLYVALYAANEKKIPFLGNAIVKFTIENIAYEQNCYIVDELSVDLLVGNKFFLKNKIDLKYSSHEIKLSEKVSIPMDSNWIKDVQSQSYMITQRFVLDTDIKINPFETKEIAMLKNSHDSTSQFFTPNDTLRRGTIFSHALTDEVDNFQVMKLLISNISEKYFELKAGLEIGEGSETRFSAHSTPIEKKSHGTIKEIPIVIKNDILLKPHEQIDLFVENYDEILNCNNCQFTPNPHYLNKCKINVSLTKTTDKSLEFIAYNFSSKPLTLRIGSQLGNLKIKPNEQFHRETKYLEAREISQINVKISTDNELPDIIIHENKKIDVNKNICETSYKEVSKLITEYADVFSKDKYDIPDSKLPAVHINLADNTPVFSSPYKLAASERSEMNDMIDGLLKSNVIEKARSNYASPAFIVRNRDNKPRMVINYKKLNSKIIHDKYPIPNPTTVLESLSTAKFLSTLDLTSAFYSMSIAEGSRHLTAFNTPDGLYQFRKVPMGLAISPAAFQRGISHVFSDMLYKSVLIYIDDLYIMSSSIEEHIKNIKSVFSRLREINLKLNPDKSKICYKSLKVLGHWVSEEGISPLPENVEAVLKLPVPKNVTELKRFLGATSYYRKFIPCLSKRAYPLTQLTRKDAKFEWTEAHQKSFEDLRDCLIKKPILMHYNDEKETYILTDACAIGIGGCLAQKDFDGVIKPVAYVSRRLTNSEENWPASHLEMLAVTYCINHFRSLIINDYFTVHTDHASLQYYKNIKEPNSRLAKLAAKLAQYNFDIVYKPAKSLLLVDALSRAPIDKTIEPDWQDINAIECVNIGLLQKQDEFLGKIYFAVIDLDKADPITARKSRNYILKDDILYFKHLHQNVVHLKLAIPTTLITQILGQYHNDITFGGHLGIHKTLSKITPKYHWPTIRQDVIKYVKTCPTCQVAKKSREKQGGPLKPITITSQPFDTICIDACGPLSLSGGRYKYIFVALDRTTRFAYCEPTTAIDAKNTAKFILNFASLYGLPRTIHTDNGSNFKSELLKQLCLSLGVSQKFGSTYMPSSQGLTERYNATLMNMLRCYSNEKQNNWHLNIRHVCFAYNSAEQASLGYSPFYLLHGFHPMSYLDIAILPVSPTGTERAEVLKNLLEIRNSLPEILKNAQLQQKEQFDKKIKPLQFKEGDKVLIQYPQAQPDTCTKLNNPYRGPFNVVKQINPQNVEVITNRKGKPSPEIIHIRRLKKYHSREPIN